MKDVIMQLIKDYFGSDILIRDIVITERRGRQTINIFPNLAANKWMIFVEGTTSSVTGLGKPDIDRTDKILEQRRTMKAQQVFAITQRILRQRQVEKEWQYEFIVYVLSNLGVPQELLEGCFPENVDEFTVEHKIELRKHLKKY